MNKEMPQLGDLFFRVCQTGIKNSAWAHADFEKVKFVEGQLDALREFIIATQAPKLEATATETTTDTKKIEMKQEKAPVASESKSEELIKPEEVKDLPKREMPPEILEAVKDGIELSKNPPRVADVKVEELSDDPDIARNQFSK